VLAFGVVDTRVTHEVSNGEAQDNSAHFLSRYLHELSARAGAVKLVVNERKRGSSQNSEKIVR